jgi:hypothetical protein
MVHKILIPITHTSPINYNDMPLPQIVHGKNLTYGRRPSRKGHPQMNLNLNPPNTLPRELRAIIATQDTVEGSNSEQPSFGGEPTKASLHLSISF